MRQHDPGERARTQTVRGTVCAWRAPGAMPQVWTDSLPRRPRPAQAKVKVSNAPQAADGRGARPPGDNQRTYRCVTTDAMTASTIFPGAITDVASSSACSRSSADMDAGASGSSSYMPASAPSGAGSGGSSHRHRNPDVVDVDDLPRPTGVTA